MVRRWRTAWAVALMLALSGAAVVLDAGFAPSADAQGFIRSLIARLRGEATPDGIVKANGLIEAAQANVSSRYPGRVTEVFVQDGTGVTIGQTLARVSSPEADVALVSPRDGEVRDLSVQVGDVVAAGEAIATIVDLNDLRMTVFLAAADAGKLADGDEARIILDAAPDSVIPAVVSFVASDMQVSPKTVETRNERATQTFRVDLTIDPRVVKTYAGKAVAGRAGEGFVRIKADAKWPSELQIKLPPLPTPQEESAAAQPEQKGEPAAASPAAPPPQPAEAAPPAQPVAQEPTPAPAPSPVAEAPQSQPATTVAPVAAPAKTEPPSVPAPPEPPPSPPAVAQAPGPTEGSQGSSGPAAPEAAVEFAPQSVTQFAGAWAPPDADCSKIFQRKGRAFTYRAPADPFLKAVIVEPQRIRLPSLTCELDSAVRDGDSLKLIAECADVISYTPRTVYVKLRSDDELVYSPTGDPILATTLRKCRI